MHWLIDFSVRRPIAVGMLYCGLLLLAWAAWTDLPVDVVPEAEFPEIIISTNWPGASPESIQSLITSLIESIAVTVPGVHKVTSTSQRGTSNVTVQFIEDINLDLARFELADRLSLLHDDLPPGIALPTLRANLPRQFRELEGGDFYSFTLRASRPLNDLRRTAKNDVVDALISVEGVSDVVVHGGQDPHLRITLEPERLELYGVSSVQVRQAVDQVEGNWPLGAAELRGTAYVLRMDHRLDDLEPLRALPIQEMEGKLVRLSDIADMEPEVDETAEADAVADDIGGDDPSGAEELDDAQSHEELQALGAPQQWPGGPCHAQPSSRSFPLAGVVSSGRPDEVHRSPAESSA